MIKTVILMAGIFFVLGVKAEQEKQLTKQVEIEVYRSPSCGCCSKWINHLKENDFQIKDYLSNDVQLIKNKHGVSGEMASCHTALIDGYVIEGHVPVDDIKKLLKQKPNVAGLSVPGMPLGTPGMEVGGKKDAYNVVSFDKEKKYKIFNSYKGN